MDFQLEQAQLSTGPLSYRVAGDGRPLVHFHSSGGFRISAPVQDLARNHRIYLPIVPGFEGTPLPSGEASVRGLAAIMAEFTETVVGGSCDVMGQSFGGWVGLWLAADRPELVEQLVVLCPAGLRQDGWGGLPRDPEEVRSRLYAYPERAPPETRSAEQLAANREIPTRYHKNVPFDEELVRHLGGIGARTLILMGTRDEVIPAETGILLKERIPHSHLTYIYDAAHAIDIDQPERVLRIVKSFLERGEAFIVRQSDKVA